MTFAGDSVPVLFNRMHLYPKMSTSTLPDNGRTVDTTWVELPGSSFRLTALKSSIRPNVPPPHLYVVPGLVPPPHCRYSKYVLRIRVFPPNSIPGDVPIGLFIFDVPCRFPSPLVVGGRGRLLGWANKATRGWGDEPAV